MSSAVTPKTDLKNLTPAQLAEFLQGTGVPVSRARHIMAWLMRPGNHDLAAMTEVKREIRELLAEKAVVSSLQPQTVEVSEDGTRKYAFRLADGAVIESVLIPEGERHTLCISSQVGCAMACDFCLTGTMGLQRNLLPAEMVGQVLAVMEEMVGRGIKRATHRELINNLVFMGMGEPLANYANLRSTLQILMADEGLGFSQRRVTVSTCGIAPRIIDLGRDARVNLAISLHAPNDEVRSRLMPINRRYGLDELLAACRRYPLAKRQVILMEYILIQGINDSQAQAAELAQTLRHIPCRINLLPYNECEALPYRRPEEETVLAFQQVLRDRGYTTLIRQSRGSDISAACGQLAAQGEL